MVLTIAQNNYTFLLHCTSVITISYKLGSLFIFVRRICCFHSKIGKLVFMVLNFITVVCPRTELDILRDFGKHNIFFNQRDSFVICDKNKMRYLWIVFLVTVICFVSLLCCMTNIHVCCIHTNASNELPKQLIPSFYLSTFELTNNLKVTHLRNLGNSYYLNNGSFWPKSNANKSLNLSSCRQTMINEPLMLLIVE